VKILIYGINYSPESIGIGMYSGEMASWFASQGNEVKVITAPPYYPQWKINKNFQNRYSHDLIDNVDVTRCPLFVPSKPTAITRLLHLLSFSASSALPVIKTYSWKADIVIQVTPTLFCSLQTILLSKLSRSKSIIHIQDYEVDAMFGLSMFKNKFVQRFAYWIEKLLLANFDIVSTISHGMIKRAEEKGVKQNKLVLFPNWSNVKRFTEAKKNPSLLTELGIRLDKKIILYSGNMGEKQGLEIVIQAAKNLEENNGVHFIMVGEGSDKSRLMKLAKENSLNNIDFFPLQSYEKLPELLASADCHLIIQKLGAADAVLPSKLTNILAVGGNAVITANEDTSLGYLCSEFKGIATLVKPESVSALCEGILLSLNLPKSNLVAKNYARNFLDKDMVLSKFLKDIKKMA
jgi:colanic acid biosynthesis glycosyl transferase WcaI